MGRARPEEGGLGGGGVAVTERRRLFAARLPEGGGPVVLDGAVARHARVLRLEVGDVVRLFDGSGVEADAQVTLVGERRVECEADVPVEAAAEGPRVVLIQCVPKGAKLDGIVRMTTELGVSAIHLAVSERSVARPDAARAHARVERLARIAREAARQAGRASVPPVVPPAPLAETLLRPPRGATRIALWERAAHPLPATIPGSEVWVLVGPEGGLSESEVGHLEAASFAIARLGRPILRVETASVVAVALLLDRLGGLSA